MKHLIIYSVLVFVVAGFIVYKMIEALINVLLDISNIKERIHYQLNIFSLERLMLKNIKDGYRKVGLPIW